MKYKLGFGVHIQRVYLPLGILTGPGWKNFSGVITPSFLKTIPFFITNCTLRNASMSVSGSPATAIRSANSPGLIGPALLDDVRRLVAVDRHCAQDVGGGMFAAFQVSRKAIVRSPRLSHSPVFSSFIRSFQ